MMMDIKPEETRRYGIVSGKEIEDGDGISHKKNGGLKVEFNWEKQSNNTYKVFASLK